MCYNVSYLKRKQSEYADRHGLDQIKINDVPELPFASGFSHPQLITVRDSDPQELTPLTWGLVPDVTWIRNFDDAKKSWNKTLNAVGENMFQTKSYKDSALNKRCIILLDGFIEYWHADKKLKVPYFVTPANDDPMPLILAGLWSSISRDDFSLETVTIVTTNPNAKMKEIHNNPAAFNGARMPLVLNDELATEWLRHDDDEQIEAQRIRDLVLPYPEELLNYTSVAKESGKPVPDKPFDWNIIGMP